MIEATSRESINDWAYLKRELRDRTVVPAQELTFVVHVFLAIILFGGLGVWTEILKMALADCPEWAGLITAVLTFFPTLIGSTALQLILASVGDKIMISFGLLVLCLFLVAAILLPIFSSSHPEAVLAMASILSFVAVWVWWITNAKDPTYRKIDTPESASGGSTEKKPVGSLEGFVVD